MLFHHLSSFRYSSSSILLRAQSTALLAAFLFWPYRCTKPMGGSSPLSLKPSIIFHASRFSPTAFATSSVHHSWFLLLGVPHPPPPTFYHTAPPPPQRMHPCTASFHPPLFPSPRLAPHTSFLPSRCILPSLHFHHLLFFGPIVLFFHFFMRTSKTTGLCCVVTYSPANALQSFTLLSCCCCRNTSRSSSVLYRPLLYVILWLFWKNAPATANPLLLNIPTSYRPSLFLVPHPNLPMLSSSAGSTKPMCALKSPATHSIVWPSLRPANLSTSSLKASFSVSTLPVWGP